MKVISALCLSLLLTGCGSLLATMQTNTIEEDPSRRTLGRIVEDDNIEIKATVNVHAADERFHDAHIDIVSYNGYVLMVGQVASQELKELATTTVRKIRGVRRIYNELAVAAPSSAITRTSDTWISFKVKAWLLGDENIEGSRVKVTTENGVVYLMGLATVAEADRIADQAANITGVQRVVKLFEVIE